MEAQKKKLSKGFWMCGWTEPFERMAYYLGRSIILIFVATAVAEGGLGLSDTDGAMMQSNLTAFSYLGGLVGGFVVDRLIGARYSTPIGMIIAGAGYFMGSVAKDATGVYIMIALISIGLALFKTGPMIGRLVDEDQLNEAYSMRYSLVNIGAFFGSLLVGVLYKDVFAHDGVLGFAPCFRLAAIVMVCGAIFFMYGSRYMGEVGKVPFQKTKTEEELARDKEKKSAAKAEKAPFTTVEKKRIGAIVMVSAFSIIFWIFWYLAYLPVYYHWSENMNWVVAGYEIPTTWFDSLNAAFCVIAGPLTAKLWAKLAARPQGDMSIYKKLGLGLLWLGCGYVYFALIEILRGDSKPSVLLLVVFFVFLTLGEMFFSPLGHSFISKYSPSRCLGLMMGIWGLATFFAAKGYGYVYNFAFGGKFPFANACIAVAVVAVICTIVLFALDKKLSALVED